MRIISTADVSLDSVRDLANDLGTEFRTKVDESQIFMRSTEPPSWVAVPADADLWVKLLGAYAALFVAELVKEAAKDTWRNRGKAVAAAILVRGQLRRFATAIAALQSGCPSERPLEWACLFPMTTFPLALRLKATIRTCCAHNWRCSFITSRPSALWLRNTDSQRVELPPGSFWLCRTMVQFWSRGTTQKRSRSEKRFSLSKRRPKPPWSRT